MAVALTIGDRDRHPKRATDAKRNHPLKVGHSFMTSMILRFVLLCGLIAGFAILNAFVAAATS